MSKYKILISFILFTNLAQALEVKTITQDNSVLKFNPSKSEAPGICWEVIKTIEKNNPDIKFSGLETSAPLPRIELSLETGAADVFICLLKSPERAEKFIFNEVPIYKIKHVVLAKADDNIEINDLAALKTISQTSPVMVPQGSSLIKFLDSNGVKQDSSTKDEVATIKKMLAGRGRFVYGQDLSLMASLKEGGIDQKQIKFLPTAFKEEPQLVAYSKKASPDLVKAVNAAIEKLAASGELAKIVEKYSK